MLDYHMHTPRCKHAVGAVREYAERAASTGLPEIGMTDHTPMPPGFDASWRMDAAEVDGYVAEVRAAQAEFRGRVTVRLGLEGDYAPGTEDWLRALYAQLDLDFVIGSVHYLGSWNFDHADQAKEFEKRDLARLWTEYFGTVERMARTGLFHVVGHMDLIKKFGHRPERLPADAVRRALRAAKETGMAVELNTSGLRRPCREIYPSRAIVEMAHGMGVPFTLSSDAHKPEEVGADFDAASRVLRDLGVRELASFERGRMTPVPL